MKTETKNAIGMAFALFIVLFSDAFADFGNYLFNLYTG